MLHLGVASSNFTMISSPLQQGINIIFVQNNLTLEIHDGLVKNFLNKTTTEEIFYTRNRLIH